MDIYLQWVDDLVEEIKKDNYIKNTCGIRKCLLQNTEVEEITIQVTHNKRLDKNLIIDGTCFRKFFEKVMEPIYTYNESIEDASKNCLKFINEWMETYI